jgi:hypothetical protein
MALGADERVSIPVLVSDMEMPYARWESYRLGRAPFPAEAIPALYRATYRVDPALALWALSEMAGLREVGHVAKPLPAGTDTDAPATDALQVGQHLGRLLEMVQRHGPEIDPLEAHEEAPTWRALEREAAQGRVKVETIARASAQRNMRL